MLLTTLALAQALTAVPPGARAVTVMVCDEADGCVAAFAAMAQHCAALGIPLLDFDAVSSAGPAGGEARAELDAALRSAGRNGDLPALEAARRAVADTPLTLLPEEPFSVWVRLGDARLRAGDTQGATEALAAAASSSAGRVWDLPPLSAAAMEQYLGIVNGRGADATLEIASDIAGTAFVDGSLAGATPLRVAVQPGWHRISVERPGRRTAWVGEVTAPSGATLHVEARVAADDAPAVLEAAVGAAISGAAVPSDVPERLARWGRTQGLSQVRFVRVSPENTRTGPPEERLEVEGRRWAVHAVWLDVASGRFDPRGPGPATLRASADPDRFSLGVQLGYARLQGSQPTGPDPHDQLSVEVAAVALLVPHLALDARVGLWESAQPYYLYEDWLSREVVPVSLGLRWAPGETGVYLGAHGLAVVPMALGGRAFFGWQATPSPRWRVGVEAHAGYTDRGPLFGGGLGVAFSG